MSKIVLEACVDSVEGALAAQTGGADRVELCAALSEGGLTPSAAAIELARRRLNIGLHVLIRPRGGDFCYSDLDMAVMCRDIEIAKSLDADGIVLGALQPDAAVDIDKTSALIACARPLSVTFHRAFDMAADPFAALDALIALGVERLLTSGQAATAHAGADLIARLVQHAADRIVIMPGGGISEQTAARLVQRAGVREVHLSGRAPVESRMTVRNSHISLGGDPRHPEYQRMTTSAERIRACRARLDALPFSS
ncbi:MAG: copper homeostasis protein CutC [Caldilineaceae bacterium]|nr:copper homeostasis protein CutC [Caldilineaceae bacterium]